jgi:hypothetical protein
MTLQEIIDYLNQQDATINQLNLDLANVQGEKSILQAKFDKLNQDIDAAQSEVANPTV